MYTGERLLQGLTDDILIQHSQGLRMGTWLLDGTTVILQSMVDPSEENPKYAFELTLDLRSRPLGRSVMPLIKRRFKCIN